jgi:hypothetical protein
MESLKIKTKIENGDKDRESKQQTNEERIRRKAAKKDTQIKEIIENERQGQRGIGTDRQ